MNTLWKPLLRHSRRIRPSWTALLVGLAASFSATASYAQYTYVPTTGANANWNTVGRWTGGPEGTFPNAIDASAILNFPLSTNPAGNFNLQISNTAGSSYTIGSLTVNNSAATTFNTRLGANGNGSLVFQSSSGPATYTENAASPTDSTGQTNIFAPVTFASDTLITQNHAILDNNGTNFDSTNNSPGGLTAASNITVTKAGLGNIQLTVPPSGPGSGFQGALVINAGAVRQTANVLSNAAAVTVNSGGQFQLGSSTLTDWNLASGAVLTLNGLGKDVSTVNFDGALRFQNGAGTSNFNNPVTLASNSSVFINATLTPAPPNSVTFGHLTLTDVVSGAGGLIKTGPGILELKNANTYGTGGSGTVVNTGALIVNNTTGSATGAGPVTVNAGAYLGGAGTIAGDVSFVGATLAPGNSPGTLTLGSTVLDAASLLNYELGTPNVVGGGINDLTSVLGNLTLDGTLNVTSLIGFGTGVYRLFDYTGSLTDNGLLLGSLPEGYSGTISTAINHQVNLSIQAVPEPSSLVLGSLAATGLAFWVRRKRAATAQVSLM